MALDDIEYLRLRAREERQRAIASPDHAIAKVHADFARLYEAAAGRLHADEQLRTSRVLWIAHSICSRSHPNKLLLTRLTSQVGLRLRNCEQHLISSIVGRRTSISLATEPMPVLACSSNVETIERRTQTHIRRFR